jgi:hypothetical protein
MKRTKARNFDEFFQSYMGRTAWMRGLALYEAVKGSEPLVDGQYRTRLHAAWFEIPKKGMPQVIFQFEVLEEPNKGKEIHRVIPVDKPSGIASLLSDYSRMGLTKFLSLDSTPRLIEKMNAGLTNVQPEVLLRLETGREGQNVIVESRVSALDGIPTLETPTVPGEPFEVENQPEPQIEPEVAVLATPQPLPEVPHDDGMQEVDLMVGMRVRYKDDGGESEGMVKMILDDDREVVVLDASGRKALIPVDSITAILAAH